MKAIKCIVELIRDETCDAKKYAKLAHEYKEQDKKLADTMVRLSEQEILHANWLHEQAVRIAGEYTGEVPESMRVVWEAEHALYVETVSTIKYMLELYRQ